MAFLKICGKVVVGKSKNLSCVDMLVTALFFFTIFISGGRSCAKTQLLLVTAKLAEMWKLGLSVRMLPVTAAPAPAPPSLSHLQPSASANQGRYGSGSMPDRLLIMGTACSVARLVWGPTQPVWPDLVVCLGNADRLPCIWLRWYLCEEIQRCSTQPRAARHPGS